MASNDEQFGRVCIVTITDPSMRGLGLNAIEIVGLRVAFQAKKTLRKEPNDGTLTVYNMSEQHRAKVRKGGKVAIEAGLGTSWGQVFLGDVRHFEHVRTGTDWETKIELKDGGRSFEFLRVSESFKPGTKISTVLRKLAESTGLDPGNLQDALAEIKGEYVTGHVSAGNLHIELERACRAAGYTYSVQDGKLQFLRAGKPNKSSVVVLGPDSGLVGSPSYGAPPAKGSPRYLTVRCLMNPKLRCGGRVDLQALSHKGVMKISSVTHSGDTAGGEWYTDIECLPI